MRKRKICKDLSAIILLNMTSNQKILRVFATIDLFLGILGVITTLFIDEHIEYVVLRHKVVKPGFEPRQSDCSICALFSSLHPILHSISPHRVSCKCLRHVVATSSVFLGPRVLSPASYWNDLKFHKNVSQRNKNVYPPKPCT